jgi:hypothetical protein
MAETDYLLRSPANAARLMAAAEEVRHGRALVTKTMDELQAMADEGEPHCGALSSTLKGGKTSPTGPRPTRKCCAASSG